MNKYLLIEHGKINFNNISNNDIDINNIMSYLKKKNITKIEDVEFLFDIYNKFLFVKRNNTPVSLIINGKLLYVNLLKINKTMFWIKKILKSNNININRILYAVYLNGKVFIIKG